jgi:hypothetical protein
MARFLLIAATGALLWSCSAPEPTPGAGETAAPAAESGSALGIRPNGDTELSIDVTRAPDELKRVFDHIDKNLDQHVVNLQKWIQQPSISNSGEGIPESAQMVKGFFEQLGCQESRVYDVPMTEWGQPGNPVVYAKCDEGAERTLLIYWMYDTMPITQPDAWIVPPFEGRIVEYPPFKKVMIGRGATNSKGPQMVQWNAFMSVRSGEASVNPAVVAGGGEMSISSGSCARPSRSLQRRGGDAALRLPGPQGGGEMSGIGGCVYIELTRAARWGWGPVASTFTERTSARRTAWPGATSRCSRPHLRGGNKVLVPVSTTARFL